MTLTALKFVHATDCRVTRLWLLIHHALKFYLRILLFKNDTRMKLLLTYFANFSIIALRIWFISKFFFKNEIWKIWKMTSIQYFPIDLFTRSPIYLSLLPPLPHRYLVDIHWAISLLLAIFHFDRSFLLEW